MKRLLTLAASAPALAVAAAAPAMAQDLAITNARLVIGDGEEPIANGTLVIAGGKVVYAGPEARTDRLDGEVIDAKGAWVTPGLFATVTTLGLADVSAVDESNDIRAEGTPFSAALDAATAINPTSQHILVSKAAGITRAATSLAPSGSIFAGQGAIIDLDGDADAIVEARAFQMINLGEGGAAQAGGSRSAAHALLRAGLREAQALAVRPSGIPQTAEIAKADEVLLSRFDAEALVPVVTGRQKLYVAVDRMADIRAVLGLKKDYPKLDLVLVGATEGWLVAPEIAAAGVPVIANGLVDLPETFEQLGATQSNAGRLAAAGVKVAINAAGDRDPRRLQQVAGNLVALTKLPGATGMSWGKAFAAISSVPAEISGMGGKAGVLKPGAVGDVVIWTEDPLEAGAVPRQVFIAGRAQDLTNHQTRLRDRYKNLDESARPKAFDW